MPKKPGRRAFKGLAPPNYRLRMMEPGEAESLRAILAAVTGAAPPPLDPFVRFLLTHEIFVAAREDTGAPAGFAAGGARAEFYALDLLAVAPEDQGRGVGGALLRAVTARAQWFFHRALVAALPVDRPDLALFYGKRGFMTVSGKETPAILAEHLRGALFEGTAPSERAAHVRWL